MKKILLAVVTASILAVNTLPLSAGAFSAVTAEEYQSAAEEAKFEAENFFVAVGTYGGESTQLRYFAHKADGGYQVDKVVWEDAPADISYGDVFIADSEASMTKVMAAPDNPVYAMAYYYQLEEGAKLDKVGKCEDFMEQKELTVTSKTYDGSAHWSIRYKDSEGKEYYYGLSTFASTLTVDPLDCAVGDVYTYALYNDYMIVPLAKKDADNDVTATTPTTTTANNTTTTTTKISTGTTVTSTYATDAKGRILDSEGNVLIVDGTSAVMSQPVNTTTTTTAIIDYAVKVEYDKSPMKTGEKREVKFYNPETKTAKNGKVNTSSDCISIDYEEGKDTFTVTALKEGKAEIYVTAAGCAFGAYVYIEVSSAEQTENETSYKVKVTVLDVNDKKLIVRPDMNSQEYKVGDKFSVPMSYIDTGVAPAPGMVFEVTYERGILTIYPSKFSDIKNVALISSEPDIFKGDTNCDCQVDMSDAVLIMQALANPDKYGENGNDPYHHLTALGRLNGDNDGDGLTVGDALAIQKKLLGLDKEDKTPVEGQSATTTDAGLTTEGGKRVTFSLYSKLRDNADTDTEIAITPNYGTDYNYVYNGKTIEQYRKEWEENSALAEKYAQLIKVGDKLKYGEALYTTGAPDGEKWDKDFYYRTLSFYGEDFLAKYIVDGEFLRDKLLEDQAEYENELRTQDHAYKVLHEAIDAYNYEMIQATIPQLEQQNIRYEYSEAQKALIFYATAAQFDELSLDNVSSYRTPPSEKEPVLDDGWAMVSYDV